VPDCKGYGSQCLDIARRKGDRIFFVQANANLACVANYDLASDNRVSSERPEVALTCRSTMLAYRSPSESKADPERIVPNKMPSYEYAPWIDGGSMRDHHQKRNYSIPSLR